MLGEELQLMLRKGYTLQYRQPSTEIRRNKELFESPIPRSRTFPQRESTEQDLWGGARNAELGAWE